MSRPSLFRRAPISSRKTASNRRLCRRLVCESLEQRALMAVLSVSNLLDNDQPGSLRYAVDQANTNEDFEDTIEFDLPASVGAAPYTITLNQELLVTSSLIIDGLGSDQLIISGNNNSRIFNIQEPVETNISVDLFGMTLTAGAAVDGAAILNEFGSLHLFDMVVAGNHATGNGGGIYTHGQVNASFTLQMTNSSVHDNTALGSGGGIYNNRDHVELHNTVVSNNQATLDGGGIYTEGTGGGRILATLYVYDGSLISHNAALRNGGGVYAFNDHVEVIESTIADNASGVDGGGIYSSASSSRFQPQTLYVFNSTIRHNMAVNGSGGGILSDSDSLDVYESTIELNEAIDGAGILLRNLSGNYLTQFINNSTINGNIATGNGAAIAVQGTPVVLESGAISVIVSASTLSGNRASDNGGGFYFSSDNFSDDFQFNSSTVADNRAISGGGIYAVPNNFERTVGYLSSTLVAKNNATTGPDLFGNYNGDSNLIGNDADSTGISFENNLVGTVTAPIDPLIGPLQDNAGPTKTHALAANSPAIDASFVNNGFDQRRMNRTQQSEGPVDIGAYERARDFGDAPDSYHTTLANNGPSHVVGGLYMGSSFKRFSANSIDSEDDGQPSGTGLADSDDLNFSDDEQGVDFTFSSTAGFSGTVQITSSGAGFANAWIDVNGNGAFDASEQILTAQPVVRGVNLLTFNLPQAPAGADASFTAIARFRLSSVANLASTGPAPDGEVEDYSMTLSRVILPDGSTGDGYNFQERVRPSVRRAYDPELAYGYNYSVNPGGDNFIEVELLSGIGDDEYSIHLFDTATGKYSSTPFVTLTAPAIFNFITGEVTDGTGTHVVASGIDGGVSKFRILGIETSAGLNPDDDTAFPTLLAFGDADGNDESIVDFTMTPLATPVAVPDTFSNLEDTTWIIPAVDGLLKNDTDRNLDTLTASLFTAPAFGTVLINADGSFVYAPPANFNGMDTFEYRANDGLQYSDPVLVKLLVISVNDAPSGTNATFTILEDTVKTFTPADFGFADPNDTPANTFQAVKITTLPAAGSLKLGNATVTAGQAILAADIANLTFTPAANAYGNAYASFTFQVQDNGGTATALDRDLDQSPNTIALNVTSVNDAPSFTVGANQIVSEDAGAKTVTAWATALSAGPNEAGQTLSFEVTNSNNALFSAQPTIAADGTLTYTTTPNAFGTAVVSALIKDNGGVANGGVDKSAVQVFTITVNSVNDAPSFVKGANLTVASTAGAQTVAGWASSILTGPANESTQTITFTVTNNNNALFSAQPTVAPNGTLTYAPASGASGTATVSVLVKDNGGTANGGVDSSALQTFTITVTSATNSKPTTSVAGPSSGVRGTTLSFTVSANDVDAGDNAAGFAFSINWGDGGAVQKLPAGTASGTVVPHVYAASGNFTVQVIATDRKGAVARRLLSRSVSQPFKCKVACLSSVAPPLLTVLAFIACSDCEPSLTVRCTGPTRASPVFS